MISILIAGGMRCVAMIADDSALKHHSILGTTDASEARKASLLAFYLPQFHPIPENDIWWGAGFTEWTNVAKAKSLYRGHLQPRLPADLGFYDLRVPEVRKQQAQLASSAGISGFVYWHYWFGNGRRILERPFSEVLDSREPDFPFCLAWANQSWTGIWHGNPKSVLIKQNYPGPKDDEAHFASIESAFHDHRYFKVQGKPLFILLDPSDHPNPPAFVEQWRSLAQKSGLPGLYLVAMWNKGENPLLDKFDGISAFGPGDFLESKWSNKWQRRWLNFVRGDFGATINKFVGTRWMKPYRFQYEDVVNQAFRKSICNDKRFIPTVLPNWDNTPRSGSRGVVFENSSPELFSKYLNKALALASNKVENERIIFLKAWNEWAEGNYLEPDSTMGHAYLDAVRGAFA